MKTTRIELAATYEAWSQHDRISAKPQNLELRDVALFPPVYKLGDIDIERRFQNSYSVKLGGEQNIPLGGVTGGQHLVRPQTRDDIVRGREVAKHVGAPGQQRVGEEHAAIAKGVKRDGGESPRCWRRSAMVRRTHRGRGQDASHGHLGNLGRARPRRCQETPYDSVHVRAISCGM